MDYIDDMFKRTDLYQIVNFILYGTENLKPKKGLYRERIEEINDDFINFLDNQGISEKLCGEIVDRYLLAAGGLEEIYLQIGMKLFANLSKQFENHKGNI